MTRMGRAERKAGEEWSYNQFASGSRIADRTWTIQFGIWDRGMNNNSIKPVLTITLRRSASYTSIRVIGT